MCRQTLLDYPANYNPIPAPRHLTTEVAQVSIRCGATLIDPYTNFKFRNCNVWIKIAIFNIYGEGKTSSAKITVTVLVSRVCYWTMQKSFIQTTKWHKAQNFRMAYFHSYHAAQTAIFNKLCYEPLIQKHEFACLFRQRNAALGSTEGGHKSSFPLLSFS